MEASSVMMNLRANIPCVGRARRGGGCLLRDERAAWGGEVRGGSSRNTGIWGTKLPARSLGPGALSAGRNTPRAGVTFSILTSDVSNDTLVSRKGIVVVQPNEHRKLLVLKLDLAATNAHIFIRSCRHSRRRSLRGSG